jgi:NAD(P)-dependent dehydrogenase (short-subunit alcohol dehydrogenase family)
LGELPHCHRIPKFPDPALQGHFYFTKLLLPTLLETAKTAKVARVINTSSLASYGVNGIDFNTVKDSPARKKAGTSKLYGQSKLVRGPGP